MFVSFFSNKLTASLAIFDRPPILYEYNNADPSCINGSDGSNVQLQDCEWVVSTSSDLFEDESVQNCSRYDVFSSGGPEIKHCKFISPVSLTF